MLDCDDTAYLAARAIQFFSPGIPQVFYVGLLGGKNDTESVDKTGEGREINRHNYSLEEIDRDVKQGVVVKLIELIKFRNTYQAFNGKFMVGNCDDQTIDLSWKSEDLFARLVVKLQPLSASILYKDPNEKETQTIIL